MIAAGFLFGLGACAAVGSVLVAWARFARWVDGLGTRARRGVDVVSSVLLVAAFGACFVLL